MLDNIKQGIIRMLGFVSKEAWTILHQPRLLFSLILGPFFILLIFGVGYQNNSRVLKTLFVVPDGSQIADTVEEFADSLGSRIAYAGTVNDVGQANSMLKKGEVDLVVVTPIDPRQDWENGEQSEFSIYHFEIDPVEETYIRVIGQRYIEVINQQVLTAVLARSQTDSDEWHGQVTEAKTSASDVRQALNEDNREQLKESATQLDHSIDVLIALVGAGVTSMESLGDTAGMAASTDDMLTELESLEKNSDAVLKAAQQETELATIEEQAAEIEQSLDRVEDILIDFRSMDPEVMVAPFISDASSVTQITLDPMHFYVPAVIALLLQHLAITLASLSIIREKLGGAMELFRAAPVTAFELLIGKYSSYILLIAVMALALTGLIIWGLKVPQLGLWINYSLILLAVMLAALGIGFHISLAARTDSQAIQYGMLTLLGAIFFSGFFLPLYRLAPPVHILSWLLPATYGTTMLQDVMLRGQTPQLLLIFGLFGYAAVLFLLAWFRLARQMARD